MLNNLLVKEFLEKEFNKHGVELKEEFKIYNGAGHVESRDADKTNGILNQLGNNDISKIMNYTNIVSNYELEMVVCVIGGFVRLNDVITVINKTIEDISCKPLNLFGGMAIFTFKMPYLGDLSSRGVIGNSVLLKLYFELQYSNTNGGKRYEMALLDFPFDEQSQNTRWFINRDAQVDWFNERVRSTGVPFSYLMQPVQSSQLTTQKTYINDLQFYPEGTEKVVEANDILLKNYAMVREVDGDNITNYWFYYVQSSKIGSDNQISVDLKMDTIQTYYFHPDIEFGDCLINRAHLNRFIDNGDGTVSFDGRESSLMYISEDNCDRNKRLTKRTQLSFKFDNEEIQNWLNENVSGWVYVFVEGGKKYNFENIDGGSRENKQYIDRFYYRFVEKSYLSDTGYRGECGIFCYPIYKFDDKYIKVVDKNGLFVSLSQDGEDNFRELNNGTSFYYQIKLSLNHPFQKNLQAKIVGDNLEIIGNSHFADGATNSGLTVNSTSKRFGEAFMTSYSGGKRHGVLVLSEQITSNIECKRYYFDDKFTFNKNEIIGTKKSYIFNPKLKSQKFKEIQINVGSGDNFIYDLQKLNNNFIDLIYSEPICPEITKSYLRIGNPSGLYIEDTKNNYLGLLTSNDTSLAIANSTYNQFLANNKNFWMQSNINILEHASMGLLGGMIAGGSRTGIASSIVGGITSLFDRNLQIDNMKSAPSQIKNANGNVLFNLMISPLAVYVEEYDILETEKEIINDVFVQNGFSYNKIDKIKTFDNIRKYFNFVQAEIDTISGLYINNESKTAIKQKFLNGIRFWNIDKVNYEKENYEKWLEIT